MLCVRDSDEKLQAFKRSTGSSTQLAQDKSVIASSATEGSGLLQVEQRRKEKQNILQCQEQQVCNLQQQQQQHVEMGELQDTSKVFHQEVYPEERHVSSTAFTYEAQHDMTDCLPEAPNQVGLGLADETPRANRQLDAIYPDSFVHYASAVENGPCTPNAKNLRDMGLDLQVGMLLRDSGAPPLRLVSADSNEDYHDNGMISDKYCKEKGWGESDIGMLQVHRGQPQEASLVAPQPVPSISLKYPGMSCDLRLVDRYDIGEREGVGNGKGR